MKSCSKTIYKRFVFPSIIVLTCDSPLLYSLNAFSLIIYRSRLNLEAYVRQFHISNLILIFFSTIAYRRISEDSKRVSIKIDIFKHGHGIPQFDSVASPYSQHCTTSIKVKLSTGLRVNVQNRLYHSKFLCCVVQFSFFPSSAVAAPSCPASSSVSPSGELPEMLMSSFSGRGTWSGFRR